MTTSSFEIPKDRWHAILQDLQRLAIGRPVSVEIADVELGDQQLVARQPLRELDVETKGSERGDFLVGVGADSAEVEHRVRRPVRILIGFDEEAGLTQWLAVEEESGAKTFVHFHQLPLLDVGDARPTAPP